MDERFTRKLASTVAVAQPCVGSPSSHSPSERAEQGTTNVERKTTTLFHLTQTHAPELYPKDEGGSKTLYNAQAQGVKLLAMYGAFPEHVIYSIVEAHSVEAVDEFLMPGFKRCTSKITPVIQKPILTQTGSRKYFPEMVAAPCRAMRERRANPS